MALSMVQLGNRAVQLKDYNQNDVYPITKVELIEGLGGINTNIATTYDKDSKIVIFKAYKKDTTVYFVTEQDSLLPPLTNINVYRLVNNEMIIQGTGHLTINPTTGNLDLIYGTDTYEYSESDCYKAIDTAKYTLIKIDKSVTLDDFIAQYEFRKDNAVTGTFSIPNNYQIVSGLVKTCTTDNDPPNIGLLVGDKYLELTVKVIDKNGTHNECVNVNLKELTDLYTAGNGLELSGKEFKVKYGIGLDITTDGSNKLYVNKKDTNLTFEGLTASKDAVQGMVPEATLSRDKNTFLSSNGNWIKGVTYTEL